MPIVIVPIKFRLSVLSSTILVIPAKSMRAKGPGDGSVTHGIGVRNRDFSGFSTVIRVVTAIEKEHPSKQAYSCNMHLSLAPSLCKVVINLDHLPIKYEASP